MRQRGQDDSSRVRDLVDAAEAIFEIATEVLELGFDIAFGVAEAAGSLVFSLLDLF